MLLPKYSLNRDEDFGFLIKRNEMVPFAETGMNLETIIESEVSQRILMAF